MSVLDELSRSCERRGLRLALAGASRDGIDKPGMLLDRLEVVTRAGTVLARVEIDGLADDLQLEAAAFELAARFVEAANE